MNTPSLYDLIHDTITTASRHRPEAQEGWHAHANYLTNCLYDAIRNHPAPATPTDPRPVGACPDQREYSVGAFTCRTSCIYLHNHTGAHRDDTGTTWQTPPPGEEPVIPMLNDPDDNPHDRFVFVNHDPCTDRPGCMLHRGHDGEHVYPNTPTDGRTIHEDRCWERDLTGQAGEIGPCVMRRNHADQHCNPNGIRWDNT